MSKRTWLRTAAAAGILAAGAGAASAAPVVWDASGGGNGNSYEVVVNNTISWDAAQSSAQSAGGNLATIDSAAEQSFVQQLLGTAAAPTGSYWFGIRETAAEGTYQDVTGGNLSYTNWEVGEPNNANGVEDRGALLWTADGGDASLVGRRGRWNDEPASGYPADGLVPPAQADVLRGGYVLEVVASDDGGGNGGNDDGGTPNAVPLPAAVFTFPVGAAFAGVFYRRMRRRV